MGVARREVLCEVDFHKIYVSIVQVFRKSHPE